jgi:acetyl esterase/lipase
VVGLSRRAYLASSGAAEPGGAVERFGGLPAELRDRARALPPVLITHGEKDEVVPVAEARKPRDLLTAGRLTPEVQIDKGVGHVFTGPGGRPRLLDGLGARGRARRFRGAHPRRRDHRE